MTSQQLLITHGTTDLQILLRDETGKLWRVVPDDAKVRDFHVWLLEQHAQGATNVVDLPGDVSKRNAEATCTDWTENTFALRTRNGDFDAHPERRDGKLCLVLPKIEPPLRKWLALGQQEVQGSGKALAAALSQALPLCPIQSVLVFSTDRGQGDKEPIATFPLLKDWLTRLGVSADNIQETVYLGPGETLEGKGLPVSPKIAARLEAAVRDFYEEGLNLILITTGGVPVVKDLLQETAYLVAGQRAKNLFKTELDQAGLAMATPLDALRIRRQCLFHVQRGAFLEAYAVAQPFHQSPEAKGWVEPLRQAATIINGNPVDQTDIALPILSEILQHAKQAACLLVAIRVESALLNDRWLEAINGSLTFLEAAFLQAIDNWAQKYCSEHDLRTRRMVFKDTPPDKLLSSSEGKKPVLLPWKGTAPTDMTFRADMIGIDSISTWSQVLGNPAIDALRHALHTQKSNGRVADYRNYNTHGVLTQEEIEQAIKRFMGANLWSQGLDNPNGRPSPGKAFLSRPLVKESICSLLPNPIEPAQLYQQLIGQLSTRLKDPRHDFSAV